MTALPPRSHSEPTFPTVPSHPNLLNARSRKDASLRQRLWHHASNVLVGVFIIATVVSNVRSITVAIVSNCTQRWINQSPKRFARLRTAVVYVLSALLTVTVVPMLFWMGHNPANSFYEFLQQVLIGWDALLHLSSWPLIVITTARAVYLAHKQSNNDGQVRLCSPDVQTSVGYIVLGFFVSTIVMSQLQIIVPSRLWNPFLWGRLSIYLPQNIPNRMSDLCVDYDPYNPMDLRDPLCLSSGDWRELSADVLDPTDADDVETVMRGVKYSQDESGGIIINIMSRDTIDAVEPLRHNVEGLLPFFKDKLAVVIFENDSKDGTRQAFKDWAKQAQGYKVDLISCGDENPDCIFGMSHRYDSTESKDYFTSSAIGKMADFRQRMVDYIMGKSEYSNYSHMLVMDLDLQVSISPLGILHTLGTITDAAVASSGRQTWPGSMGTLMPPYDFSAFRAVEDDVNRDMLSLHQRFCELMPAGDRWRNQCDAVSPMQLMLVLGRDRLIKDRPYEVTSAFNGATLYPLQLIRETDAKYDAGDDGQRCEHIGFNMGLKKLMYINPKWNFNIAPENPGGPTGYRAFRNVVRIFLTPKLSAVIGIQIWSCLLTLVYSIVILSMYLIYPILSALGFFGSRRGRSDSFALRDDEYLDARLPMLQSFGSKLDVKHV